MKNIHNEHVAVSNCLKIIEEINSLKATLEQAKQNKQSLKELCEQMKGHNLDIEEQYFDYNSPKIDMCLTIKQDKENFIISEDTIEFYGVYMPDWYTPIADILRYLRDWCEDYSLIYIPSTDITILYKEGFRVLEDNTIQYTYSQIKGFLYGQYAIEDYYMDNGELDKVRLLNDFYSTIARY